MPINAADYSMVETGQTIIDDEEIDENTLDLTPDSRGKVKTHFMLKTQMSGFKEHASAAGTF